MTIVASTYSCQRPPPRKRPRMIEVPGVLAIVSRAWANRLSDRLKPGFGR
jgi:hypothetical protein